MSGYLTLLQGDCLERLKTLPDRSVHCCVTSPPYLWLRDYGVAGQIGLESSPEEYIQTMVDIFREVRRVLRDDGTLWLNLGDSTKGKQLLGMPWRVALALQADGWYLRSDIIWHKPNAMPESAKDRPTKSHEYIFLMTKRKKYYYDAEAIKEPVTGNAHARGSGVNPKAKVNGPNSRMAKERIPDGEASKPNASKWNLRPKQNESFSAAIKDLVPFRNKRSVWTVASAPYKGSHFATFPPNLIKPCILAGCPIGGTVLDPFAGSGTTGQVAIEAGRRAILIELSRESCDLILQRTNVTPGLPLL